ncbi:CDC14A_9 [Blepharisma stoltei]|uniref:Tyrosine specific protein phosphatases domain-containing protein n=1 Tax=Blepharisma stoltei TaxID=1481888 RepID=A0AAU9JN90_9CILI|nr:unnamed protein product [Blepharisma stoltei]
MIRHYDIYFVDGSVPNREVINQFLRICEEEPEWAAVHCKDGLGKANTLIGMYAMKHYRFPAEDFIGYIRLCRPEVCLAPSSNFYAICRSKRLAGVMILMVKMILKTESIEWKFQVLKKLRAQCLQKINVFRCLEIMDKLKGLCMLKNQTKIRQM